MVNYRYGYIHTWVTHSSADVYKSAWAGGNPIHTHTHTTRRATRRATTHTVPHRDPQTDV